MSPSEASRLYQAALESRRVWASRAAEDWYDEDTCDTAERMDGEVRQSYRELCEALGV